ncbi:MAG: ribosome biogenesis GTP-binding protein YihA/YsxC [Marinilabiliaceae bacterium]|nr:ribosome biogenesis GTP-binding protein YihA/YsxC [Marinilabiliaceae bacterium]
MTIKNARFLISSPDVNRCPVPEKPEFAFIGRSNVGKSSLINMLCNSKNLAKTSATPGKTQMINHFIINDLWYLVDLPGYGFVKSSKTKREQFGKIISDYVLKRENLYCLFVLIDSRHDPLKIDLSFMEMLGNEGVPFAIVFTKTDKLGKEKLNIQIETYKKSLLENWEELPPIFVTSAEKKVGKEEIAAFIADILKK